MNCVEHNRINTSLRIFILLWVLLCFAGCKSVKLNISPVGNPDVADLTAEDIVLILIRAGFTEDQVMVLGTALHNQLSTSGAVEINGENKVEAIIAVSGDCIYVSSRMRGHFIYNYKEKGFLKI